MNHSILKYIDPKFITLLLLGVGFALLPLQNNALAFAFPISRLWNDFGWFFSLVLLIFYLLNGEHIFSNRSKYSVHVSLFLCSLVLIFSIPFSKFQLPQTLKLLLASLSIPYFIFLIDKFGKQLLVLIILATISLHAQWAIVHFIAQQDLSMQLLGESNIANNIPGVAKFQGYSEKLIRAYGPYPHPNILATSTIIGLTLLLSLLAFAKPSPATYKHTYTFLFFMMFIALLLTFSRAAVLGILLLGFTVWLNLKDYEKNEHFQVFRRLLWVSIIVLLVLSSLFFLRTTDIEDKAVPERSQGIAWSIELIKEHPITGVGVGNYVSHLDNFVSQRNIQVNPWEITYVHSVPLLLLSEFGFPIGVLVMGGLTMYLYKRQSEYYFLPLVPLFLTDHNIYTSTSSLLLVVFLLTIAITDPASHTK